MFPLTLDLIDFLLDEPAKHALTEFARADLSQQAELRTLTALRQRFSPDQAAALLDQARLRERAKGKFPQADRLLFVDDALQQASSHAVATYRAQQFVEFLDRSPLPTPHSPLLAPRSALRIADLGCGIGADTIALAEAGLHVLAVERDPVRARIAQVNVAALDLAERVEVLCADWTTLHFDVDAVFVDPSRRSGEQRIFRLADMEPPFSAVLALLEQTPALAVKMMPGIADEDIPSNAEVEFISERGAMKEALLRFGGLRSGAARSATLLPGSHQLNSNEPLGAVLDLHSAGLFARARPSHFARNSRPASGHAARRSPARPHHCLFDGRSPGRNPIRKGLAGPAPRSISPKDPQPLVARDERGRGGRQKTRHGD